MPDPAPSRSTALITGASAGIGYELAKVFAEHRHDLILVARNESQLQALAHECRARFGVTATVIAKDLSLPFAPQEIVDQTKEQGIRVDILVNNAGFGTHGQFAQIDLDADLRLLQVNIVALTHLTKLFLRDMIARGTGKILNVASTAAFQPGPLMATYYASKAYVLWFSEAIAHEAAPHGVSVTALCPGPTKTEFQKRAGIEGSRLFKNNAMDARRVAVAGYRGLMRAQRIVIPGLANRLASFSTRLAPRWLLTTIAGKLNEVR